MPVYELDDDLWFPGVELAEKDGLLAVGGDLRPERLLFAYSEGLFPWYSPVDPILWWSPDPRLVLYPPDLKIARSMRPVFNQELFTITFDTAFAEVIRGCKEILREQQSGTWITDEMEAAYIQLHELGFAHSVEVWREEKESEARLVGGLYGVSLGLNFFGESMFSLEKNASKAGFIQLVKGLQRLGFHQVDCQVKTSHLLSLGAQEIPRTDFIRQVKKGLEEPTLRGKWTDIPELRKKITF